MPAKGHTNNPNGRPKKGRGLADALARELAQTVEIPGATPDALPLTLTYKDLLARIRRDAAVSGTLTLLGGRTLQLDAADVLALQNDIYKHLDGPPKAEVDVTTGGRPLTPTPRDIILTESRLSAWKTRRFADDGDPDADAGD